MSSTTHHWLTLHRVRFQSAISARERKFETPALPECWRFCPDMNLGPDGFVTFTSESWCGLGIHDRREDAEAMLAAPQEHMPWLAETVEQWHALLLPFTHRGKVNWRGMVEDDCAIRPSLNKSAGPMAVLTSAGFNSRGPDQMARFLRFYRGIQEVLDFYGTLAGNIRRAVLTGGFDGLDGFTLSLWPDDKAMTRAAYSAGVHRSAMETHRETSLFDRSSFTRARIVSSIGSWDGNPVPGMA